MNVPQGPFILALTTRCPLFPLFLVRVGRCRYRVEIGPPFACQRTGRDKDVDLLRAGTHWSKILREQVRRHWDQWLVVEANLKPTEAPSPRSPEAQAPH